MIGDAGNPSTRNFPAHMELIRAISSFARLTQCQPGHVIIVGRQFELVPERIAKVN